MATLSKCPRFVIVFDNGDRCSSETVYQSDLPDMIRRLVGHDCRINDVIPEQSEWDEEVQFQAWQAEQARREENGEVSAF